MRIQAKARTERERRTLTSMGLLHEQQGSDTGHPGNLWLQPHDTQLCMCSVCAFLSTYLRSVNAEREMTNMVRTSGTQTISCAVCAHGKCTVGVTYLGGASA